MTAGEGFYRQPIALIGYDGLELGGNGREPVSLPPRQTVYQLFGICITIYALYEHAKIRRLLRMKGNEKVIERLNARLADELTAISQYMVHSEMCANWGFEKLHEAVEKRAIQEMKHAEKLIGRIFFLEGIPIVSKLNKISIGAMVEAQFKNDLEAEVGAVKFYNDDINFAAEAGDNGTKDLLQSFLNDEEDHADWLETQLDQIKQIGLQNYLTEQLTK